MNIPTTAPCCPNHGEPLEDVGFPIPRKGRGMCPVSGVRFDFEAELNQNATAKDKNGNLVKVATWNVEE